MPSNVSRRSHKPIDRIRFGQIYSGVILMDKHKIKSCRQQALLRDDNGQTCVAKDYSHPMRPGTMITVDGTKYLVLEVKSEAEIRRENEMRRIKALGEPQNRAERRKLESMKRRLK